LALTAGLAKATGNRVPIIDADLQDPPELLSAMMDLMGNGADVVHGHKRRRSGESVFKLGTPRVFYRVLPALANLPVNLPSEQDLSLRADDES
jgi:dolichol-phosphate mannosyltransferase